MYNIPRRSAGNHADHPAFVVEIFQDDLEALMLLSDEIFDRNLRKREREGEKRGRPIGNEKENRRRNKKSEYERKQG